MGALAMDGYVGATRRFVIDFDATQTEERPFAFRRAALEFGGELAEFRADRGITLNGSLPKLSVDEWLALSRSGDQGGVDARANWSGGFAGADLNVAEFSVFGQQLGSTRVAARRRTDDWQFELDSNAIAGTLLVPMDLRGEPQVVAVMRRLYLNAGDGSGAGIMSDIDPRELPGVQLHADEFGVGTRQIGRLDAEILADPLGLRLVSFESATDSFTAQGSGGWFVGDEGADTTRFAVGINSTNVGEMLRQLGVAPFVEAETAEVTASRRAEPASSTCSDAGWARRAATIASAAASALGSSMRSPGTSPASNAASEARMFSSALAPNPRTPRIAWFAAASRSASIESMPSSS